MAMSVVTLNSLHLGFYPSWLDGADGEMEEHLDLKLWKSCFDASLHCLWAAPQALRPQRSIASCESSSTCLHFWTHPSLCNGHRSAFNIVYNGLPVQQLWQQLHNKRKRGYIPSISIQSNEVQYVPLVAVF